MIQFRTLGSLGLTDPGGLPVRSVLAQPKRVALLAYLAAATPRGSHRRDTLLGLLWPESDHAHARASLRKALHSLRRSLGAEVLLGSGDEEIALDGERLWCDAPALEEAVREGRHREVASLYRGEFLRGLFVPDAPEFERWMEAERQRLSRATAGALEALAGEHEARGDLPGAVKWWRQLCDLDPYSSRSALRLVRALDAAGDPTGALRCAKEHSERVRMELGAEPLPEILEAVERLRQPFAAVHPAGVAAPDPAPRAVAPDPARVAVPVGVPAGRPPEPAPDAESRRARVLRAPLLVFLAAVGGVGAYLSYPSVADPLDGSPVAFWIDPARSVAVLPFDNLSGDPQNRYFGDGLTEDILVRLSRVEGLRVVSRTSVLRYRETTKSVGEIAAELRVEHVLEGSVRRYGNRVRISAQLIDARWDRHLWAGTYDREVTDVLHVQSEIAEQVTRALHAHLGQDE